MTSGPVTPAATFDHVGISVADLGTAAGWYCAALGLEREFEFDVPHVGLRGAMLLSPSGYRVELLEREGSARHDPPPVPVISATLPARRPVPARPSSPGEGASVFAGTGRRPVDELDEIALRVRHERHPHPGLGRGARRHPPNGTG